MIIRFFRALLGCCVVAGFTGTAVAQTATPSPAPLPHKVKVTYTCDNLKLVAYYDNRKNRVAFVYASKHFSLPHVPSADGARYMNSTLEWWEKGPMVTLSSVTNGAADSVLTTCKAVKTVNL